MVIMKIILIEDNLWDMSVITEGPQAWCSNSNKGARVELLLQVGDPHLSLLIKFNDLICY